MGLDMYAFAVDQAVVGDKKVDTQVIISDDDENGEEIHYWRKHHDLHGWMQRLYQSKGGQSESFNCDQVVLTSEDLDRLETDIKEGKLPRTEGLFFGNNPPDVESHADDFEFIRKAREAIADGKAVIYDSWW
ncbi:hypothetical protein [Castellaniella sp.]|uniref:hypothetical protein n=1 Tax=Castellaniella sp. TaxID=1955812 RepID=UPI002AFF7ABA|nr:hypothetical protein [Castellaniella sp.]